MGLIQLTARIRWRTLVAEAALSFLLAPKVKLPGAIWLRYRMLSFSMAAVRRGVERASLREIQRRLAGAFFERVVLSPPKLSTLAAVLAAVAFYWHLGFAPLSDDDRQLILAIATLKT